MEIEIVSIGSIDETILKYLVDLISERFRIDTKSGKEIPIEKFIKDASRNQYLSTNMLEELSKMKQLNTNVILGISDVDLYVPYLNFIFGEAYPFKKVAVISITRLRQSFYSLKDDEALLLKRTGKEAVHELGHIFNLRHCTRPKCVMFFSNSLQDTDGKEDKFCLKCRQYLSRFWKDDFDINI